MLVRKTARRLGQSHRSCDACVVDCGHCFGGDAACAVRPEWLVSRILITWRSAHGVAGGCAFGSLVHLHTVWWEAVPSDGFTICTWCGGPMHPGGSSICPPSHWKLLWGRYSACALEARPQLPRCCNLPSCLTFARTGFAALAEPLPF